jgi:flavin-dependent dehydrogenase
MKLDVAIVGGGLAGGTLARQLRARLPTLEIGVFERETAPDFKVGESTVEIASVHLARRLGLSTYLYEHHLPKNGLRFFFDDPDKSAAIEDMSEIGTDALPFHPSFQLDRARLDADLRRMNADDGVLVRTGTRVTGIEPGSATRPHRLELQTPEGAEVVHARWLVDASGRGRVLSKALRRPRVDVGHALCAAWGRFRDVVDIDTVGPTSWRDRVRGTSRYLSTNHFCYPGYWIWFIPIGRGLVSVGVVCDRSHWRETLRHTEGLLGFLREHRGPATLLERAAAVDTMSLSNVSYGTTGFFSSGRWACVGEAAAFTDPLYSPGSDFIALENDLVTDLIVRDQGRASAGELEERVELYDAFMRLRLDANLALYRGLYSVLGSFELFALKWAFDIHGYYNLWLHAYLLDQHLDPSWLREQVRLREPTLDMLGNFSRLFGALGNQLRARGEYHRGNRGRFSLALEGTDLVEEIGRERPRKRVLRATGACCNRVLAAAKALQTGGRSAPAAEPMALFEFMRERDLLD